MTKRKKKKIVEEKNYVRGVRGSTIKTSPKSGKKL